MSKKPTMMRAFRKHWGLRQIETAKLLGISSSLLRKIDKGEKSMDGRDDLIEKMKAVTQWHVTRIKNEMKGVKDHGY
jgi:predicted transcriptional regulator